MKLIGNVFIGLIGLMMILFTFGVTVVLIGSIMYFSGWVCGFLLNFVIGPEMLFGLTFEQFFGIVFLVSGIFGLIKLSTEKQLEKNIEDKLTKRIEAAVIDSKKEYRGY